MHTLTIYDVPTAVCSELLAIAISIGNIQVVVFDVSHSTALGIPVRKVFLVDVLFPYYLMLLEIKKKSFFLITEQNKTFSRIRKFRIIKGMYRIRSIFGCYPLIYFV